MAAVTFMAAASGLLHPLDLWISKLRFEAVHRQPTGSLLLVDIDAASLHDVGEWPWKRSVHAAVIDRLVELGASEIAVDVDFSTTSLPDQDAALVDAVARAAGKVTLAVFRQRANAAEGEEGQFYNQPFPALAAQAWTATVNVRPESDGTVRAFSYGEWIAGKPVPSIPAVLGGGSGSLGQEFLIDFSIAAEAIHRVSVRELLAGEVARNSVQGRKAIVGASALELQDFLEVPVYGQVSGHVVLALATETLLQHRQLRPAPMPVTAALLCALAILAVFALRFLSLVRILVSISIAAIGFEIVGLAVQGVGSLVLSTVPLHLMLLWVGLFASSEELRTRGMQLFVSRRATRHTETILRRVIEDNFAGVVVVDESGLIRFASRIAVNLLDLGSERRVIGAPYHHVLPAPLASAMETAIAEFRQRLWRVQGTRELRLEIRDRGECIFEYTITPSEFDGSSSSDRRASIEKAGACLTFSDVTEKRNADAQLSFMARFDPVTGLPNRNHFVEVLTSTLAQGHRPTTNAVMCFDLDRFKNVNDTLGHHYGDLLLSAVGRRVADVLPDIELLSRLGGDEFAVLATGKTRAELADMASRLTLSLRDPFDLDGHRVIIGASIGIAVAADAIDPRDPMHLLKNADIALYRAKESGGTMHMFFDPTMNAGLQARQRLEVELWEAFREGQFALVYQPQYDLQTHQLTGVEALIRWHHPTRGVVSPGDFIGVAEAIGLIGPLGDWVLRTACIEVAARPGSLQLAVNVSALQFSRGNLVATVRDALAKSGLPRARLHLEITESLFVQENAVVAEVIEGLRQLGVSFALDDFGTGYSSLAYIRKFPIAKIKIDRSFVMDLPHDAGGIAIIKAVSAMAQSLGMAVTAEGIETMEQAHLLRELGVDEGQGYLFGRATSLADLPGSSFRADLRLSA